MADPKQLAPMLMNPSIARQGEKARMRAQALGGVPGWAGPDVGGFLSDPQSYRDMGKGLLGMVGSPLPNGAGPMMSRRYPELKSDPEYMDKMMGMGLGLQTVFHGSPHKFDKFDMSKVGTGEGAQAYGHGLYFAENPEVSQQYKLAGMSGLQRKLEGVVPQNQVEEYAIGRVNNHLGNPKTTVEDAIKKTILGARNLRGANDPGYVAQETEIASYLEKLWDKKPKIMEPGAGNIYKVDLPDEHITKMLDWDKPLSQQQHLFENVGPYGDEFKFKHLLERLGVDPATTTGRDLLTNVMGIGRSSEKAAAVSKSLKEFGIPGISYLDQGSRTAGEGTRNFVVFDDQIPKILSRE